MKTKDKILQEALRLFNERGLSQVGVREIARSLGISVGNLSYHFPKKEDLIMELLSEIRMTNDAVYEEYFGGRVSLDRFLDTFRRIMENQYRYRGVFLGHDEINQVIKKHFDYLSVEQKRRKFFHRIYTDLAEAGELKLTEADIEFLISFITLFGRFWMMEASISYTDKTKQEVIDHYMGLLERQLGLFKT